MIEYIVAHKELIIVLCVMVLLGTILWFLPGAQRKQADTKSKDAANKGKTGEGSESK